MGLQHYASKSISIHSPCQSINRNRCIVTTVRLESRDRRTVVTMKARRQAVILELIDGDPLHSQEVLRRRLKQRGFTATQATISRDIKELGLVKRAGDGAYQRMGADTTNPETALAALERAAGQFLRRADRVQQLLVLRTGRGEAQ